VKAALAPLRVDAGAPSSTAARPSADAGPPSEEDQLEEWCVDPSPRLADGLVEGKTRLVVWATDGLPDTAQRALAPFTPRKAKPNDWWGQRPCCLTSARPMRVMIWW
jgi:hypothetical protein